MTGLLLKVLDDDRRSMHGGSGQWTPGRWRSVRGPLSPCAVGLHLCRLADLPLWLGPQIWIAEAEGDRIDERDKIVVSRARIVRRVEAWDERTARLFAADCAERVLTLFEATVPGDNRPRQAIDTARRFARGEATREDLAAARAAALAAARAAARDAAWAAARAAAWAAAWAAAGEWQAQHLAEMLGLGGHLQ